MGSATTVVVPLSGMRAKVTAEASVSLVVEAVSIVRAA